MDHEYELEDEYAPRILWARLAFFLLALVLAFVFGRCTKSTGVDEDVHNAVKADVVELASEKALLEEQLRTAGEGAAEETGDKGGKGGGKNAGTEEEATEEPADEGEIGKGETYTVQSGDTLTTIAEKFYGDAGDYELIVDANNLDDATGLTVGQELVIPPNN